VKYEITHNGQTKSMRQWAEDKGINYYTAKYRWQNGCRDFDELFSPEPRRKELYVPEWAVNWLRETHRARAGQSNEWQIACELIGLSAGRAKELKRVLEGRI